MTQSRSLLQRFDGLAWTVALLLTAGGGCKSENPPKQAEEQQAPSPVATTQAAGGQAIERAIRMAESGNTAAAQEELEKILADHPENLDAHVALGIVLARQSRFEDAIREFQRVLAARPDAATAKIHLGYALVEVGKLDEAEKLLREVLTAEPNHPGALQRLGILLEHRGKYEEAAECLEKAAQIPPPDATTKYELGKVLTELGRDEDARKQLEQVLLLVPRHAPSYLLLGVLSARANNQEAAVDSFRKALAVEPRYTTARFMLAQSLSAQQDFAQAAQVLRDGLEKLPDDAELLNGLAWLLATAPDDAVRNGTEAVRLAEKACQITSRLDPSLLDTLAAAYAEAGEFDEALKTQEEAIRRVEKSMPDTDARPFHERLELYRAGRPYRQQPAATQPATTTAPAAEGE